VTLLLIYYATYIRYQIDFDIDQDRPESTEETIVGLIHFVSVVDAIASDRVKESRTISRRFIPGVRGSF
jgi:hypothetical protein